MNWAWIFFLYICDMSVAKPYRILTVHSFKKYFVRIVKLYIWTVLINIRNIYVKYSNCEPIHFKKKKQVVVFFLLNSRILMEMTNMTAAQWGRWGFIGEKESKVVITLSKWLHLGKQRHLTRAPYAVPTLVCQWNTSKYSFQSYAPCLTTAPCHDEQAFKVCCWLLLCNWLY